MRLILRTGEDDAEDDRAEDEAQVGLPARAGGQAMSTRFATIKAIQRGFSSAPVALLIGEVLLHEGRGLGAEAGLEALPRGGARVGGVASLRRTGVAVASLHGCYAVVVVDSAVLNRVVGLVDGIGRAHSYARAGMEWRRRLLYLACRENDTADRASQEQ